MTVKWTEIELLYQVVRGFRSRLEVVGVPCPTVVYRGKVKLHGTNAGVRISPTGEVTAQSRTADLTPEDDNAGFAKWVAANRGYFAGLADPAGTHIIFGEWCGSGIQKGTAINQIGRKVFAVFSVEFHDPSEMVEDAEGILWPKRFIYTDPYQIQAQFMGGHDLKVSDDIYILPWHTDEIALDFADEKSLQSAAEAINAMVEQIEACDPWVKATFGADGIGEGLVYYPITAHTYEGLSLRDEVTRAMFKAKGEKHAVKKQKEPVQVDPDVVRSTDEFVAMFVTEARCEQAVSDGCGGVLDSSKTGAFLAWINKDIEKESGAELEANGLTWRQVQGHVARAARDWYLGRVRKV